MSIAEVCRRACLALLLLAPAAVLAEGPVMRDPDSPHVWYVDAFGVRHHVGNPGVLKRFWKGADVQLVPQEIIDQYPPGARIDGRRSGGNPGAGEPGWFMRNLDPEVAERHEGRADRTHAAWFDEHSLPLPALVSGYAPPKLGPPLPPARELRSPMLGYRIDVQYRGFIKKSWDAVGRVDVRSEPEAQPDAFTVELDLEARDPRAKQNYRLGLAVTFRREADGRLTQVARSRKHQPVQSSYEHKILELMPFLHIVRQSGRSDDRVERYKMGARDYVLLFKRERGGSFAYLRKHGTELGKFFLAGSREDGSREVTRFRIVTKDDVSIDFVRER